MSCARGAAGVAASIDRVLREAGVRPSKEPPPAKRAPPPPLATWTHDTKTKWTPEQCRVMSAVHAGVSLFFTGAAGTGKSYLLLHMIERLREAHADSEEAVVVAAPTGMAAVAISGSTVHAFSGIGIGEDSAAALVRTVRANAKAVERWLAARVLIIDEVSMLSASLFDKLEHVARAVRRKQAPFGGLQLVLCGDFFQLPPVVRGGAAAAPAALFCFQSKSWSRVIKATHELTTVFRQAKDAVFLELLDQIRVGRLCDRGYDKLVERVGVAWGTPGEPTRLYALKEQVDGENAVRLAKLPGEERAFFARDTAKYPRQAAAHLEALNKGCAAPAKLVLKTGAAVLLLKNMPDANLFNGSRGLVVAFEPRRAGGPMATADGSGGGGQELYPVVEFDDSGTTRIITPERFTLKVGAEEVASRDQLPLALAWALSIHKAQGMTLSRVEVALDRVFEFGQAYVALSRATSLAGLKILSRFPKHVIKAHPAVVEFHEMKMDVQRA